MLGNELYIFLEKVGLALVRLTVPIFVRSCDDYVLASYMGAPDP